jgi:hypothetical protein
VGPAAAPRIAAKLVFDVGRQRALVRVAGMGEEGLEVLAHKVRVMQPDPRRSWGRALRNRASTRTGDAKRRRAGAGIWGRARRAKPAHEETFNDFRVLLASVAEPSFAANLAAVPDRAQLGGSEDE